MKKRAFIFLTMGLIMTTSYAHTKNHRHIHKKERPLDSPQQVIKISESFEHIHEGDASGGPNPGYLLLESHRLDLPERTFPIDRWPIAWKQRYLLGNKEQKRFLSQGLTYGEIAALSGDLYETYDDLSAAPLAEIYELLPLIHSPLVTTKELQQVTGGRYLRLAMDNKRHFSNGPEPFTNLSTWRLGHKQALLAAQQGKFFEAWIRSAAAAHFLTDAFCGGHVRVPRTKLMQIPLLDLYSKILHDLDNEAGVRVNNRRSDGPWIAYGDALLQDPRNEKNRSIMLEALRLSKQEIQEAFHLGEKYQFPQDGMLFAPEYLVPFPIDKTSFLNQDSYAYSSLGLTQKGWDPMGISVLIGHFKNPNPAAFYGQELKKLATKELPNYIETLLKEDEYARDWVTKYPLHVISRQPIKEKIRLLLLLLKNWVSQDDLFAAQKIVSSCTSNKEKTLMYQSISQQNFIFPIKRKQILLEQLSPTNPTKEIRRSL